MYLTYDGRCEFSTWRSPRSVRPRRAQPHTQQRCSRARSGALGIGIAMRAAALGATRAWVRDVVVGLALCPWANPAQIRYAYTDEGAPQALFRSLVEEMEALRSAAAGAEATMHTTLLVHPAAFSQRDDFPAHSAWVQQMEVCVYVTHYYVCVCWCCVRCLPFL